MSSKTKFTPGPWTTYDSKASGWWVYAPNGIKNACTEGQAIANCGVTALDVKREELDANAALIAAAPEMFETLVAVRDAIEEMHHLVTTPEERMISIKALEKVYKALQKARGES